MKTAVGVLILGICISTLVNATGKNPSKPAAKSKKAVVPAKTPAQKKEALCKAIHQLENRCYLIPTCYLSVYLEITKKLDCPQFHTTCKKRHFRYTPFASLLAEEMCDRKAFVKQCTPTLQLALGTAETNWEKLSASISKVSSSSVLEEPCVQVATHDRIVQTKGYSFGSFEEIKRFKNPYNGFVWCGVAAERSSYLSAYFCSGTRYRATSWLLVLFLVLLAMTIFTVNLLAFLVIVSNSDLRNGQGVFRLNLAIVDFIVGSVVLPMVIYIYHYYIIKTPQFAPVNPALEKFAKDFFANPVDLDKVGMKEIMPMMGRGTTTNLPKPFIDAVGFFMTIILYENIYCLAVAGVDRLIAITFPFWYDSSKSKKAAVLLCLLSWCIAGFYALIPLVHYRKAYYGITDNMFSLMNAPDGMVETMLALPLCLMVVISLAIYFKIYFHNRNLARQTTSVAQKAKRTERRLANTLGTMVLFFSLSIVPNLSNIVWLKHAPMIDLANLDHPDFDILQVFINYHVTAQIFLFCNSIVNFFIYQHQDQKFKAQMYKLFGKDPPKAYVKKPTGNRPTGSTKSRASTTDTTSTTTETTTVE